MSCSLYRHYDAAGVLLYIGISASPIARLLAHCSASHWAHRITTVRIERCASRARAVEAESKAIKNESPLFNQNQTKWPPLRRINHYDDRFRDEAEARYLRIKRMRERTPPMKLEEIAELEGCSRQRVAAILRRGNGGGNGR